MLLGWVPGGFYLLGSLQGACAPLPELLARTNSTFMLSIHRQEHRT